MDFINCSGYKGRNQANWLASSLFNFWGQKQFWRINKHCILLNHTLYLNKCLHIFLLDCKFISMETLTERPKSKGERDRSNKDKTERQWQEQRKEVSKKKVTETDTEVDEGLKVCWTVWPSVWVNAGTRTQTLSACLLPYKLIHWNRGRSP